ncbi:hypothetical protein JYK02_14500 [Corallococcus macrosporus]|uniref:Uncharacterized protein n=1 Tax=Corallococcus macrosporus TaxID=35 RepID=A0ABS3DAM5_9BACT|nr:hypothetical protein [Corallococcus macrosporus]MBN8228719.1 hypothetical protein [Corallococcus macrosporus]
MPGDVIVLPVPVVPDPIVFPEDPYWKEQERMQAEAWRYVQKTLRETGMLPKWELLLRDPKFAAAVAAETARILGEAAEELAKRRGIEYGILLSLQASMEADRKRQATAKRKREAEEAEEEFQRKRVRLKYISAEPRGLQGLVKERNVEQEQNVTYGKSAELRSNLKHWAKGKHKGDRLVIVGTLKGVELKEILLAIDPRIDVSEIQDHVNYGGDLMVIGLEPRDPAQRLLWGRNDRRVVTKTVQMKWGETADPEGTLGMITYAGLQLAGLRDETPAPGGLRVISVGVLNPDHPWNKFDGVSAALLVPQLLTSFAGGENRTYSVPRGGLYSTVDRIVIRTQNWTFRFYVDGENIHLASATYTPDQHADLLAEPRPAKDKSGEMEGMLIKTKTEAWIQMSASTSGQKKYKIPLSALPSSLNSKDKVVFTVDPKGNLLSIRKKED